MELIKQIDCAEAIYEALRTPMLKKTLTDTMSLAMSLAKEVPTVEAEPTKHGRWEGTNRNKYNDDEATCSICGVTFASCYSNPSWWEYCPNCGAKMDGGENVD